MPRRELERETALDARSQQKRVKRLRVPCHHEVLRVFSQRLTQMLPDGLDVSPGGRDARKGVVREPGHRVAEVERA